MATTTFNSLILQASRRVQEYRTSAASTDDTNRRWKSSNWTDYLNRAIRDFLKEKFVALGAEKFAQLFPDYMKQSGVLALVAGSVAKPVDAFAVTDLWMVDNSATFTLLPQELVPGVISGRVATIVPDDSNPVFYEEGGSIKTLGILTGSVYARYVRNHSDLAVITTAAGNGKADLTGIAPVSYIAATRILVATNMSGGGFAAGDENRMVMFVDASTGYVYFGRIASVTNTTTVTLYGDGLPVGNIASLSAVVMEQRDSSDISLNSMWFGEILDITVAYAQADAIPETK